MNRPAGQLGDRDIVVRVRPSAGDDALTISIDAKPRRRQLAKASTTGLQSRSSPNRRCQAPINSRVRDHKELQLSSLNPVESGFSRW
jgi:hypothetical protein